jgi:hypothetical protein
MMVIRPGRTGRRRIVGLSVCSVLATFSFADPGRANLFTHILREAGEAGGKAAGHAGHAGSHLGAVGKAAAHLKSLAGAPKGALAAHATPEGHWQFVNREGHVFTAGTTDEMRRVLPTLAPEAAAGEGKLSLYLSEDSIFHNRAALDTLPKDATLHVVTDSGSYALTRSGSGGAARISVKLKPHLTIDATDWSGFDEAVSVLSRSLNKSNIRTIALEPGAPNRLPSAPRLDPTTKLPQVDQLDPVHLAAAFRSIRGQTVLVTGRVDNGKVVFSPSKGPELTRDVDELVSAASQNDVNLVILHSDATRQPGGRNWLWQTVEVGGLKNASTSATFGDFLDALGARRGGFQLESTREGFGRVHVAAKPADGAVSLSGKANNAFDETIGHVTGEIVTKAAEIHIRDDSTQKEHDARLIAGIPTYIQIPYLIGLVAGLIGWATVRSWWARVWPPHVAAPAARRLARWLNAAPRALAFLLVFLPIVGIPALIWQGLVTTWQTVTGPFRWFNRRFLRREV